MTDRTKQQEFEADLAWVIKHAPLWCSWYVNGAGSSDEKRRENEEYKMRDVLARLRATKVVVVPEGQYCYVSRFKPGDETWVLDGRNRPFKITIANVVFDGCALPSYEWSLDFDFHAVEEEDCFFTKAEAEAECAERNRAKEEE